MEPWQSWTVVLLGGGAAWWYYNRQNNARGKQARAVLAPEQGQKRPTKRREDSSRVKRKTDGNTVNPELSGADQPEPQAVPVPSVSVSSAKQARKRRSGKKAPGQSAASSAVETPESASGVASEADGTDEGIDNKEFARQLSGIKAGTSLAPPASAGSGKKAARSVRTSALSKVRSEESFNEGNSKITSTPLDVSTTSSTTGADADDDLSPAASPALGAVSSDSAHARLDVSDMLEAQNAGPSVLRLTESTRPISAKQAQHQRPSQVPETKKQRQNRRKAEEKKLLRQEDEKERRVLLEKQLRTAREAEGRPAKNGLAPSSTPTTSAWAAQARVADDNVSATAGTPTAGHSPLLDTFDHDEGNSTSANDLASNGTSATTVSNAWERDLPSEEDQMRMLTEINQEAGWNTVPKGRKGKKNNSKSGDSDSNDAAKPVAISNGNAKQYISKPDGSESSSSWGASNGPSAPTEWVPNPNDSDWAVV
ncbi:MAG: hypothetical protein M1819_000077 [Sarea resinae]|nr:MAG: hypothetical protein M1819_000077 [Sarea resinae]